MAAAVEKAYEAIRTGILSGTYAAGTHLKAADLADSLGISRTPVREAMRRLHAEGLINFIANHGAYVARFGENEAEEIFTLRSVLESLGAELAATRIDGPALAELRALADHMEELAKARRPADYLGRIAAANERFHRIILAAAGNQRLAAVLASVVEVPLSRNTFNRYTAEDLMRSMDHHRELLAAFQARDGAWAASVMRCHVLAARRVFLSESDEAPPAKSAAE